MRIILTMSVSGSILLLCTLLFQPFWDGNRIFLKYSILKVSIAYYLIPFPLIKIFYNNFFLQKTRIHNLSHNVFIVHNKGGILLSDNSLLLNNIGTLYILITLLAFTFSIILIIFQVLNYFKIKKMVTLAIPETDDFLFKKLVKILRIKKKIRLSLDAQECRAFSIGYRRPFVIIPTGLSECDKERILCHELYHIKSGDTLIKFLTQLVICLHWFNPLVYMLMYLTNDTCEMCCDALVVRNMDDKERGEYCKLLIKLSTKVENDNLVTPLKNRNISKLKRRILNIMKTKKRSKINLCLSIVISGIIFFLGSIPVMAYEAPPIVNIEGDITAITDIKDDFENSDLSFQEATDSTENREIIFDHQFIDQYGNIYNADTETQSSCQHNNKVAGTVQDHIKNSNGSCNIKVYDGERCVDCGKVIVGGLISNTYYTKCPH